MKTFWAVFFAILAAAGVLFLAYSNHQQEERKRIKMESERISIADSEIGMAARAVTVSMHDTSEGDIKLINNIVRSLRNLAKDPLMPEEKRQECQRCADETIAYLQSNLGKYWVAKLDTEPATTK